MTALPSNLSLTNIADDAPIIAADHRNNYSAIQAYANALNGILDSGAAGQLLKGVGSDVSFVYPPGYELGYDQITASVNVTGLAESSPTTIVAGTSRTYESVPYLFTFSAFEVVAPSTTGGLVTFLLLQDGTSLGRIANITNPITPDQAAGSIERGFRFTPTAGAHTFSVAAYASSTTGTPSVQAGTGGAGAFTPAYLRVTKV